jgi:hemerythrin
VGVGCAISPSGSFELNAAARSRNLGPEACERSFLSGQHAANPLRWTGPAEYILVSGPGPAGGSVVTHGGVKVMSFDWNRSLEIGDSVVDSEHRYLLQLIYNMHEQYERGTLAESLAGLFAHLAHYARNHFTNEEALMSAIGYPHLDEHQQEHSQLVEQAMELSEQFIDGEKTVTRDTIEFLRRWAIKHIAGSDMRIRAFLKGARPPQLTDTPAFATRSGPEFKTCTFCGKTWKTFGDLARDPDKTVIGCQVDLTNHLYNLVMFNCSCQTTLAMFLKELATETDIPFVIDEHEDPSQRPAHCMKQDKATPCLARCACAYTKQVLDALAAPARDVGSNP